MLTYLLAAPLLLALILAGPPPRPPRLLMPAAAAPAAPDTLYRWGQLTDARGRPLVGVTLRFRRLRTTAVSDSSGTFQVAIPLRRAVRLTRDQLEVNGPAGMFGEVVELFAAGPIQIRLPAAGCQLRAVECTLEDIVGPERAAALRRQVRQQRRAAVDSAAGQRY